MVKVVKREELQLTILTILTTLTNTTTTHKLQHPLL